jgi:short-subunit dehydrogenase
VNTASLAGLTTIPSLAPYGASKHAVLAISEVLHHELTVLGSAVRVSVLCPGFVKTRIAEANRNWLDHMGPEPSSDNPAGEVIEPLVRGLVETGKPPEELAEQALDAMRTGRFLGAHRTRAVAQCRRQPRQLPGRKRPDGAASRMIPRRPAFRGVRVWRRAC